MTFEYCASCVQQPAPTHIHSHQQTTNHIPAILQNLKAITEAHTVTAKPHSITKFCTMVCA